MVRKLLRIYYDYHDEWYRNILDMAVFGWCTAVDMVGRFCLRSYQWSFWYRSEIRLLWYYSTGWWTRYGKTPYKVIIIPMFIWGCIASTLIYMLWYLYDRPPVFSSWCIGRCHKYMRGKYHE